ncbi:MAG: SDR family oxidoreductase [Acidobacteria bacterium]|nr:SDR family oxidoreductase [Acidobacteriota bacterium]
MTGAAKGIGLGIAESFARAGATVGMLDCDQGTLEAAAARASSQGGRCVSVRADVTDRPELERAVASFLERAGTLDVLVNNAGIHFARTIDEYTEAEWARILDVNLTGAFRMIQICVPALRRSRGAIVSVSSMTGLVGQDRGAAYVASKGALISLTKALALELATDGIRVNCVCPAGVDTPLLRDWAATLPDPDAVLRGQAAMHLTNRLASPNEIASAVLFLASPAASFITGIALPVEGGATLGYRRT